MSGPSHAEEVGRGMATANVVASEDEEIPLFIQDVFMCPFSACIRAMTCSA